MDFASEAQAAEFIGDLRERLGTRRTLSHSRLTEEIELYYIRQTFYIMKLVGEAWFDGDVPVAPNAEMDMVLNPAKMPPEIHKKDPERTRVEKETIGQIIAQLAERCRDLRKPRWVAAALRSRIARRAAS